IPPRERPDTLPNGRENKRQHRRREPAARRLGGRALAGGPGMHRVQGAETQGERQAGDSPSVPRPSRPPDGSLSIETSEDLSLPAPEPGASQVRYAAPGNALPPLAKLR